MRLVILMLASAGGLMADVTGTWIGHVDRGERPGAHFILKQEGTTVTGSGGPDADDQMAIRKGFAGVDGAVTFEIVEGDALIKFELRVNGDEIQGVIHREKDGVVEDSGLKATRVARKDAAQDLTKTITALDAGLFASYNACELDKFRAYLSPSIEFFHDRVD